MSLLLHIDTAVQTASVCISENENCLGLRTNPSQKDQAAWLHVAIRDLLSELGLSLHKLNAVSISEGPGSYTGLRVGMATAKGLCYILKQPLITVNTLKMMAVSALDSPAELLCPMIDARRMEVFTAVFDHQLEEKLATTNMVLDEQSFDQLLSNHTICFFGNGSVKFQAITKHQNVSFKEINATAEHMISLAFHNYKAGLFADLAYAEPFYAKDFHSVVKQIFIN